MLSSHKFSDLAALAFLAMGSAWTCEAHALQIAPPVNLDEIQENGVVTDDLSWLPSDDDWLPPSDSDNGNDLNSDVPIFDDEDSSPISTEPTSRSGSKPLGLDARVWVQTFDFDFEFSDIEGTQNVLRGTLDYNNAYELGDVTLTLSNRFDISTEVSASSEVAQGTVTTNTFREAYFSTPITLGGKAGNTSAYLDVGRVNVRNGVAAGYSPVDVFKDGAVVTSTSFDPGAQRLNRLGSVMARAQIVGDWGTASAGFIPKLQARDENTFIDESPFALRLDRTNFRNAFFAKVSPVIGERASVDLFVNVPEDTTPLFGAVSSVLVSDSIVFNAEGALVRAEQNDLISDAPSDKDWNARISANVVWTLEGGVELTGELFHAADALGRSQWREVRRSADPDVIARLNQFQTDRTRAGEPLLQTGYFTSINWRDAFGRQGLDLATFATGNFYDGSLLWQTSITQDFSGGASLGFIASGFEGTQTSEFGSAPLETYVALYVGKTF